MSQNLSLSVTLKAINKATGPLKKIMQGSQGVGRAMRETRDEMRDLQAQQKKISAFRDMSRKAHGTRRALMDQREELRQISEQLKNTTGPTKRLTQQQGKAQAAADRLSREYKDQRNSVRDLSRELPEAARGTRGLTQQNDALEEQIRQTNQRLNTQRDALGRLANADVGGRFSKMTGQIGRFTRTLTVAGGAAAGGIFALAKSTASLGDDVGKTASKLGLTNTELQELRYAGERSGVATNVLDSSMVAFTKRLGEAAGGTGAAVKGYDALGLSAKHLAELPVSEAMAEVADKMKEIENPTRRNAIAAQLYSRSGVGLVNMLKDGSAGLKGYAADARSIGYALGDKAIRDSEKFQDTLLDTQLSLGGMKNIIGAELLPVVGELMSKLTGWLAENRDEVKAFAKSFGQNLKDAVPVIKDLAEGAASFAKTIVGVAKAAADALGGYDKLAIVLGSLFAAKMIASVISFGVGVGQAAGAMGTFASTLPIIGTAIKAVGAAIAATPIGWLIAGVTAVAGAAWLIYKNWEPIKAFFGGLWQQVKSAFDEGLGGIGRLLLNWSPLGLIWAGISSALGRLGIDLPASFTELGSKMIVGLGRGIKNVAGAIWGPVKAAADAAWGDLKTAFDGGVAGVTRLLIDWSPFGLLWRGISEALSRLGVDIPEKFSGMGGWIIDGIKAGITGKLGELKDSITGVADSAAGWFKDKLQINSPSRVFAQFGGYTIDGLNRGLDAQRDEPARRIREIAKRVAGAGAGMAISGAAIASPATPSLDGGAGIALDSRPAMSAPAGAGSSGLNIHSGGIVINVNAAPGMDEQALAREVSAQVQRALEQSERRAAATRRRNLYDND